MEQEIVKLFATLGIGGILAGVIFYFYRLDRMRCETNHEILIKLIERTAISQEHLGQKIEQLINVYFDPSKIIKP